MVALLGGLAALLLGIIGLISWWHEFIYLLKGCIPVLLLLGGALAAYLGAEEIKDKRLAEQEAAQQPFQSAAPDESVDKYKQEVSELKAKLAAMESPESGAETPPEPPAKETEEKK